MRKLFLLLFIALSMWQTASATLTFDTVWIHNCWPMECQFACFSTDTTKILAVIDSTIYFLDIQTGNPIDSMEKAPGLLAFDAISANQSKIAASLPDNRLAVWDINTKRIIKIFGHDSTNDYSVVAGAFSPDGRYLVCGMYNYLYQPNIYHYNIFIYDFMADSIVKWIDSSYMQYVGGIGPMEFSPNGNYFLASLKMQYNINYYSLIKYSANGWYPIDTLENLSEMGYNYLSFSNDGKYLAGSKDDKEESYVRDMETDTILKIYTKQKLGSVYNIINFSPDNQYLLFGAGSGWLPDSLRTQIWDFVNDTSVYHTSIYSASAINYSINGKYLLLAEHIHITLLTPNWTKTSIAEANANNENTLQIQPNPATEAMTISYNLSNGGNARLSLYNQLGQEVAMLKEGWEDAGEKNFRFTVSDCRLNAGVYFVRLQADSEVRTGKVLIY